MDHELNYRINLRDGSFGVGMKDAINKTSELDGLMGRLQGTIAAAFTIGAAKQLIDETTEVATKFQGLDNVIKFASKSQEDYAANQQFLNDLVRDMKLPLQETTEGFSGLMGAMKGSVLQGQATRDIFRGVATAGTVLHLSNQQQQSAFLALQQMMSKGKVSAQELTLQLGQAIPGANKLAADAMGMTTAAFGKSMEKGEIMADVFLPRFAAQLEKTFGPGLTNALDSSQSKMNESNNAIVLQEQLIGNQLMPAKLAMLDVESKLLGIVSSAINFYQEHSDGINAIAIGAGLAAATMGAYTLAVKASAMWTGIAGVATELYNGFIIATEEGLGVVTAAQWAWNAALDANPIGVVVMGLSALAAGIVYAYNKFDTFKAVMAGVWQTMKDGIKGIIGYGKVLVGALTLNPDMIQEGMTQLTENAKKVLTGQSMKVGYSASMAESAKSKKEEETKVPGTANQVVNTPASLAPTKTASSSSLAGGSSSGGGSGGNGRAVTVNIQNMVKDITYNAIGGSINAQELERQITTILVRAVRDFETTQ